MVSQLSKHDLCIKVVKCHLQSLKGHVRLYLAQQTPHVRLLDAWVSPNHFCTLRERKSARSLGEVQHKCSHLPPSLWNDRQYGGWKTAGCTPQALCTIDRGSDERLSRGCTVSVDGRVVVLPRTPLWSWAIKLTRAWGHDRSSDAIFFSTNYATSALCGVGWLATPAPPAIRRSLESAQPRFQSRC